MIWDKWEANDNMIDLNPIILIITLKVNSLARSWWLTPVILAT
jgi:hypothetical protein